MENLGIYIHIPFCIKKCNYCAFLSFPADEEVKTEYIKALKREINRYDVSNKKQDTIFFGGGTPSFLNPGEIEDIISELNPVTDAEITLEANPATLTYEKLVAYREAGINRLSLGVQSLNDEILKYMGRLHTVDDVYREYEMAKKAGFDNINLDLMFAVPGDNVMSLKRTLKRITKLNPKHISYYSLQLEEGTHFYKSFLKGEFKEIPDELDRRMYHEGSRQLINSGYKRYEISNFAKPGYECKHNLKYWNMDEYIGFGLGASSFIDGSRFKNTDDMKVYLNSENVVSEKHINTKHDDISEAVFTGLRKTEGIYFRDILGSKEDFMKYYENSREKIEDFIYDGFLRMDNKGMKLTDKGIDISNKIMAEFV